MKKITSLMLGLLCAVTTLWAQPQIVKSTASDPVYYVIASYNRGGVLTNAGVGFGVTHEDLTDAGYWYFEAVDGGGYNFVNKLTTDAGEKIYLGSDRTASTTPATWYIVSNGVNTKGLSICSAATISGSNCVDANNYDTGVGGWAPSTGDWEGTTWVFQISDPKYNPSKVLRRTYNGRKVLTINLSSKYSEYNSGNATTLSHEYAGDYGLAYIDLTKTVTMKADVGETVTPSITRDGGWTNAYLYIDKLADGFTASINGDYEPADDLVSYSFFAGVGNESTDNAGYNSAGTELSGSGRNTIAMPAFTAPTEPGLYRMRFKHDWNSIDPNGDGPQFFSAGGAIIDVMLEVVESTDVTVNFPEFSGKNYSVTIKDVPYGVDATELIPTVGLFTVEGLKETDKVVSAENNTFNVTGTWTFPFELNTNYRIRNHGGANEDFTYFYYNADANRIQTKNLTDSDKLTSERVFYVKSDEGFDESGNLKVTLHSVAAGEGLGFTTDTGSNNTGSFTENPTTFLVVSNSSHNGIGVSFRHSENSASYVNAYQGTSELGIWQDASSAQNDSGSSLRFYSVEDDMSAIPSWVENGNAFAALDLATQETQDVWTERIAQCAEPAEYTYDDYNELLTLYSDMVNSTATTAGDAYITVASFKVSQDLMCVRYNNGAFVGRYGNDVNGNKTTWKVVAAEGGFKLYNEYAASYLKFPSSENTNSTVVSSEEEASVFILTLHNPLTAQYGIKCIEEEGSYPYLHTNNDNRVVRWSAGDNSSWYLAASSAEIAASEATVGATDDLVDAIAYCGVPDGSIGADLGYYTASDEYVAALNAAKSAQEGDSVEVKHNAAATLRANVAGASLNKPEAGKFYKIKAVVSGHFVSAPADGATGVQMVMSADDTANNILYLDDESHLLVYGTGYYIDGKDHAVLNYKDTYDFQASKNKTVGAFAIKPSNANYWHDNTSSLDVYSGGAVPQCDWYVEEVDYLPIAIDASSNSGTIYSPVGLGLTEQNGVEVKAFTGLVSEDGSQFIVEEQEAVPANTGVIVSLAKDVDLADGCVYLPIQESTVIVENNDLTGTFATAQISTDKVFYTFENYSYTDEDGEEQTSTQFEVTAEDVTTIKGFTAYIEREEGPNAIAIFDSTGTKNPTGIEEVGVAENAGQTIIYDLQGRRLSAPVKGINIINGKKVLVK